MFHIGKAKPPKGLEREDMEFTTWMLLKLVFFFFAAMIHQFIVTIRQKDRED